ncbi:hypothetical protein BJ742DRAFT_103026 [Cladochytrium replicatum]|nr:hypothetical protein BJ742DRAFT_103026 [Cladochytrium replicatum]
MSAAHQSLSINDTSWKAVGSPPRRPSISAPHTPENRPIDGLANGSSQADFDTQNDLISARLRALHRANELESNGHSVTSTPATSIPPTVSQTAKWGNLGMQWTGPSSIWKDGPSSTMQPPAVTVDAPDVTITPALTANMSLTPNSRQYRSYSFSIGSMGEDAMYANHTAGVTHEPLRGDEDDELDYTQFSLPKVRSRSKSSSAIYGIPGDSLSGYGGGAGESPIASPAGPKNPDQPYHYPSDIWGMSNPDARRNSRTPPPPPGLRVGHEPAGLLHRRASTQPSHFGMWDALRPPSTGPSDVLSPDRLDRYRSQRRFSHAPGLFNDYNQSLVNS